MEKYFEDRAALLVGETTELGQKDTIKVFRNQILHITHARQLFHFLTAQELEWSRSRARNYHQEIHCSRMLGRTRGDVAVGTPLADDSTAGAERNALGSASLRGLSHPQEGTGKPHALPGFLTLSP